MKTNSLLLRIFTGVSFLSIATLFSASAFAAKDSFNANLIGYEEVPSISVQSIGTLTGTIDRDDPNNPIINYELTYSNFDATVLFAHIHFGQKAVNGGVSAFLCGGGNKPPCAPGSGTVTGTITAADVIGPAAQGIAPGEIGELIDAMCAGLTYANVHTAIRPGGEIRGQIEIKCSKK